MVFCYGLTRIIGSTADAASTGIVCFAFMLEIRGNLSDYYEERMSWAGFSANVFAFISWLFYDLWILSFGEWWQRIYVHVLSYWWKLKVWQVFHHIWSPSVCWWDWEPDFHNWKLEINSESGFHFSYDKIDEMFWFWYQWKDQTRMDMRFQRFWLDLSHVKIVCWLDGLERLFIFISALLGFCQYIN